MRGDQLARQGQIIRAIEASPNGLTARAFAQREETGISAIYLDLEALWETGFRPYNQRVEQGNRWVFIDPFKFKIPSSFFSSLQSESSFY
jgi:predicted DNA-binding transcriptional regulator YafY